MKRFIHFLSFCAVILTNAGVVLAAGQTYHVNKNIETPGDGTSWALAFKSILAATAVAEPTDEIWVAGDEAPMPMIYVEDSTIPILDRVKLLGGFPPTGDPGSGDRNPDRYVSIISADSGDDDEPDFDNRDDNLETLINIESGATVATIISGFTIRGAIVHAIEVGATARPVLDKLIIIDNGYSTPIVAAAGVHCGSGSLPTFTDCRFEGNRATEATAISGGLLRATRCQFIQNVATVGAGGAVACSGGSIERLDPADMATWLTHTAVEFRDCQFQANTSADRGGAVFFEGQLRLISTQLRGNEATNGGAIAFTFGSVLGLNLDFDANQAGKGGAVYNDRGCFVTLINTLANDNEASDKGGVIYMEHASTVFLQNVTFARNQGENGALWVDLGNACNVIDTEEQSDRFVQIKNSIVWDHEYPSIHVEPGNLILEYNDLDYGTFSPGGISTNPLFLDPAHKNFRLKSTSPCLDAGDTRIVPQDLFDVDSDSRTACDGCNEENHGEYMPDLDFHQRVTDAAAIDTGEYPTIVVRCPLSCEKIVDMGVYEFVPCADCEARGDLNGDGLVNGRDIQPFTLCAIHDQDAVSPCLCADFSGPSGFPDGMVDSYDVPCFIELLLTGSNSCSGPVLCGADLLAITDCNENEIPDADDIAAGTSLDCNKNGVPDECDISSENSADVNSNDTPDECETDCDGDTIPDAWAIAEELVADINANGIPDACDPDCDHDDQPDDYEIAHGAADCNSNGVPDSCEVSIDCNSNGVPDDCDINPLDPDGNASVSEDCNGNGIPDECDLARSILHSFDCNDNNVPDECDIANETSEDANENGIPDECEESQRGGGEGGGEFDEAAAWELFYEWYEEQVNGTPGDWGALSGPDRFERVMDELELLGLPYARPW